MNEVYATSTRLTAAQLPLDFWPAALLSDSFTVLSSGHQSASWSGTIAGNQVCVLVEDGSTASPVPGLRALDFATRTGTPLISIFVDGGSTERTAEWLRATHLLSGVVPSLAIEQGQRTPNGELRAAAADFATAVTLDPERRTPHFSEAEDAAVWAKSLIVRLPANRTANAPVGTDALHLTARTNQAGSGIQAGDPAALITALSEGAPSVLTAAVAGLQTGFLTLRGHTVGFVASTVFGGDGELSADDAFDAARLLQFCDAFHLPAIIVCDSPGLRAGVPVAALNPLVRALAELATPLLTLVTGRTDGPYGSLITDPALVPEVLAWPRALPASEALPACARAIHPADTADELFATLSRWGGVDAPLPKRRGPVLPR